MSSDLQLHPQLIIPSNRKPRSLQQISYYYHSTKIEEKKCCFLNQEKQQQHINTNLAATPNKKGHIIRLVCQYLTSTKPILYLTSTINKKKRLPPALHMSSLTNVDLLIPLCINFPIKRLHPWLLWFINLGKRRFPPLLHTY